MKLKLFCLSLLGIVPIFNLIFLSSTNNLIDEKTTNQSIVGDDWGDIQGNSRNSAYYYQTGRATYKWLQFGGPAITSAKTYWSIEGDKKDSNNNEWIQIEKTWIENEKNVGVYNLFDVYGTFKWTITDKSFVNTTKNIQIYLNVWLLATKGEKDVTFNIYYQNPTLSDITLTKASGSGTLSNNNITVTKGTSNTFNASCTITNQTYINPTLTKTWSLQNALTGVTINSSTGLITIGNQTAQMTNRSFNVVCKAGSTTKSQAVNLTVNYANPILGTIVLTKFSGDAILNGTTINQVYGTTSSFNVACSIVNPQQINPSLAKTWSLNNAPSGVSIDATNGLLVIDETTNQMDAYSFSVQYAVGTVKKTLNITLTISYATPILDDITLTKASGDATITDQTINQVCGDTSTFDASCDITNHANIDPSLAKTWSINNAPNGVSIDGTSGLITIASPNYGSNQTFSVTYTVGTITQTQNFILNVDYASPLFTDITLQGNGVVDNNTIYLALNTPSNITASCNVTNHQFLDPSLTSQWSLKNPPSGINIDSNTGSITIPNNLAKNHYSFTIVYHYGTSSKESVVNLEIGYQIPQLDTISLTGDNVFNNTDINVIYGNLVNLNASCNIVNSNFIDPDLPKSWSLQNVPNPGIEIDSTSGLITLANNLPVMTNANFDVIYQVGNIKATLTVNLTVSYATPTFSDITLQGTGVVDNSNISLFLNQGATINASCNVINPNNIDPSFNKSWTMQNEPNGMTINSTTGEINIPSNLAVGHYSFTLIYQCGTDSKQSIIDLSIGYETPALNNITLNGDGVLGSNINLIYNESSNIIASCNVNNEANINPSLPKTWSINNASIPGMTINNSGQLTIPTTQVVNNTSFEIIYQVGGVRQTLSVTLTISYATPILDDIMLTKASGDAIITGNIIDQVYGDTSTLNASCNITNNINIDPNLPKTWSLNNAPSGVSIDGNSGLITINNPNYGDNQTFSVTYTIGTITKTQRYTLNVDYAVPKLSEINLTDSWNCKIYDHNVKINYNQAATFQAQCQLLNENNINPNLPKAQWSLLNAPFGINITQEGLVTIASNVNVMNNCQFEIVCQVGDTLSTLSVNLTINQSNKSIFINPIFWSILIPLMVAILIIVIASFYNRKRNASQD